jgi:hypothetical protein
MAMGMTMMITIIMFTDINARQLLWRGIHADHREARHKEKTKQNKTKHTQLSPRYTRHETRVIFCSNFLSGIWYNKYHLTLSLVLYRAMYRAAHATHLHRY